MSLASRIFKVKSQLIFLSTRRNYTACTPYDILISYLTSVFEVTQESMGTATIENVAIEPGLHVEIPAKVLHGIDAGSEGVEFIWTFGNAARWTDIPYIYKDTALPNRNVKNDSIPTS